MAHPRRFRFGVQLHQPLPGLDWAGSARRVEELGYSTLFLPDHFGEQYAPIAAMTAAAAATERLAVGTLVFDNDYRHPVVLAKEMATIDVLFGGRCEVGMGAGWMRSDYDTSGIAMDPPKVRVDRLQEGVAIVKGLWGAEPVTFDGEHYRITDLVGLPRPHTEGGPPLIIAGGSPRMLRFAGAQADIVGVNPSIHSGEIDADAARDGMADRMDRKVEWVKEGAGARWEDLEINAWVPIVAITDDATSVAEMIAPGFGLDPQDATAALESPMTMVGTQGEIVELLQSRRERWGFSYHVVQNESALDLAPIVAELTGT
jgi:probable F420-dependent oxidoreductase